MLTDVMLSFRRSTHARCNPKAEGGAWLLIEDDKTTNQVSVFLPHGIPAEKIQTIADAINDALDFARVEQSEAA